MRLSARMLDSVAGVNNFNYAQTVELTEGDSPTVYFQLIDASQDRADKGFVPAGRRYMPASGATLTVVLGNIDDARKVTKSCTQPYASDPSIWSFQLLASDTVRGTVNMTLTLTESSKVTKGLVQQAISVECLNGLERL